MAFERRRHRTAWQIGMLVAGLLVLATISTASVLLVARAQDDARAVAHSIEVENEISLAGLQLRQAESAQRGFLISQSNNFVADFENAAAQLGPTLDHLRNLTRDNPAQRDTIAAMTPLMTERLAQLRRAIDLTRARNFGDAIDIVQDPSARAGMDRIRELAANMRAEEDRLFTLRSAAAHRSALLAAMVTIAGSALVVGFAIASIVLVRRSLWARDLAEARLRDSNLNLENMVAERTADLREANEEIQRFAYIVSHDLRSPLVNIMGFTSELDELRGNIFRRIGELTRTDAMASADAGADAAEPALDGRDKQLADDFSEALGFIKSSIAKMDRLISAILKLTREGRREFRPERIGMRGLIEGIAATVAHQAQEANAGIRIESLPDIVSDRLALEQIFSNLIDNALKYLRTGVPGEVVIRGRQKLGFAIYEVSDNGRGIEAKDHQRIFDLFRRAGVQDRPGQGIGLAHVRALVRRLGGSMSVDSTPGRGSTFVVTLPAHLSSQPSRKDA